LKALAGLLIYHIPVPFWLPAAASDHIADHWQSFERGLFFVYFLQSHFLLFVFLLFICSNHFRLENGRFRTHPISGVLGCLGGSGPITWFTGVVTLAIILFRKKSGSELTVIILSLLLDFAIFTPLALSFVYI
jgi:hypothetical protein